MALGLLAVFLIVTAVLFVTSIISVAVPAIGLSLIGFILLGLAFILPADELRLKLGKTLIGAKTVSAIAGAGIIVFNLASVSLQGFFSSFVSVAPASFISASFLGDLLVDIEGLGIEPASFGSIFVVVSGTILSAYIMNATIYRGQLLRSKRS